MKKMYCRSSTTHNSCLLTPIITKQDSVKLSYLRYYDEKTNNADLKLFVVKSTYNIIKKSHISLSEEDFIELKELFVLVYNQLKEIDKFKNKLHEKMIDILNTVIQNRKLNIDLYKGVSIHNGIALFNDGTSDAMTLIKDNTKA